MEQRRLHNIFEQMIYRTIRREFTERLQAFGRKIIKNADVTPEEALGVLQQFVRAAFEEALCRLTPEDLKDSPETPVEDPIPEATSAQPDPSKTDPEPTDSESEGDLEQTIAQHILGIRTAARKLVTRSTGIIDQSLDELDAEVQVVIDGTTHAIKDLSRRLREKFAADKPAPSSKTDDPKDPPATPAET